MSRKHILPVTLLICMCLCSCGAGEPDRAASGWEEDWTAVGEIVASEPVPGFEARENLDAMSASGLWYATWTAGEAEVRENEEGQRSEIYDAQIYLLIQEFKSSSKALAELEIWKNRERDSYVCGDTVTGTYGQISAPAGSASGGGENAVGSGENGAGSGENGGGSGEGVSFEILPLLEGAETNPYSHGVAAFGCFGDHGVCAELMCGEEFDGEPMEILEGFLSGLHFNGGEAE